MKYGFGVDLGGTTVKLACFTQEGVLIHKWEIPTVTADSGSHILPDIAEAIAGYCRRNSIQSCMGIGIGVPGPVDGHGVVNRCINLGWGVLNVEQTLSELTGLQVRAGNDATVAALGEYWQGGGKGSQSMVMVTLGTGVGGGIIIDGKVLYGAHGAGGEIGHMVLNREETEPCPCGKKGCVEQYCSATGIVNLAKRYLKGSQEPSVLRGSEEPTCKDIFEAGKSGDPAAQVILQQVYGYLGEFLANICCVVNPETVVLGGGVSKAGQMLLDGVRPYLDQCVFHACRDVRLALATLGNDAGVYGAFKLIQER